MTVREVRLHDVGTRRPEKLNRGHDVLDSPRRRFPNDDSRAQSFEHVHVFIGFWPRLILQERAEASLTAHADDLEEELLHPSVLVAVHSRQLKYGIGARLYV